MRIVGARNNQNARRIFIKSMHNSWSIDKPHITNICIPLLNPIDQCHDRTGRMGWMHQKRGRLINEQKMFMFIEYRYVNRFLGYILLGRFFGCRKSNVHYIMRLDGKPRFMNFFVVKLHVTITNELLKKTPRVERKLIRNICINSRMQTRIWYDKGRGRVRRNTLRLLHGFFHFLLVYSIYENLQFS